MTTPLAAVLAVLASAHPLPVIANPASEYCIAIGGRLEIVTTATGQIGICILPDGRRIEEWALYRSAHNAPAEGTKRP